jgi:NADH dehydrogenase FAD-containing subunit
VNASWIKLHLAATLHPRRTYVDVVLSEVTGVDTVNRRVLLPTCDLPYDYLILATGIHVNYFGHDEWKALLQDSMGWMLQFVTRERGVELFLLIC